MEESEYENNFPLFRQVHLLLLLKLQLRQLLTQQQQLMQTHQLIHGMQLMAMDTAMVLDIIDMAMEDMDIWIWILWKVVHQTNSYTCNIFIRRLFFDFYQFYQSISLLDQPCFRREMSLNIRVVGLLLLFVLIFFQ